MKVQEFTLPSHPSTSSEETFMYPLVVLLKVLFIRDMHCELYIRVIHFGALHFGTLLEFNALEFDILEFIALSSASKFCTL